MSDIPMGAVCRPNISALGRKMRTRAGYFAIAVAVVATVATFVLHSPPLVRFFATMVPLASGLASLLQVRRHTCVLRAVEGTFEHDDARTKTKMAEDDVRASRKMAVTIVRDATLIAVAVAAVLTFAF